VRYRIDGSCTRPSRRRPTGDAVVNVFKVLSAMDISEKRKPQGRLVRRQAAGPRPRFPRGTSWLEGRREAGHAILDNSSAVTKMEDLGMRPKLVEFGSADWSPAAWHVPVLWADRAGKSTTLYAASAKSTATSATSITVEDPIEYHWTTSPRWRSIPSPAKPSPRPCGRFCARPRRHHDRRIRDQRPPRSPCQAANTGHMVFSTFTPTTPSTALFRLLDLGVEPFMIASGALGGRSGASAWCESSARLARNPTSQAEFLKKANAAGREGRRLINRRPKTPSRYARSAAGPAISADRIYELLVLTESMRDMIRENPSINKIKAMPARTA